MTKLELAETDNRDPTTTTLVMGQLGNAGSVFSVDVDPTALYKNMVDNCFKDCSDVDTSMIQDMVDYLNSILRS
jgi:hypothetical protein